MGPGENAGAVDVGGGLVCAFKVESHNHPSAVEPFQGAATGVGGILRDIFAIGARPIAVLDSLRFGEPLDAAGPGSGTRSRTCSTARCRASGTTATRSACPRSAGEVYFEAPYEQNCLVNAMALGLGAARAAGAQRGGRARATCWCCSAPAPAATGSAGRRCSPRRSCGEERTRTSARPSRSGDPFEEKKLLECSLELLRAGAARLAAGPRRRRPDLLGRGDGLQGRRRDRHRRRQRAAARAGHGAVRGDGLASPRSGCCAWSSPRTSSAVLALCEKWEVHGHRDRHGHRHAAACACFDGGELVGDMPVQRAGGRLPAV